MNKSTSLSKSFLHKEFTSSFLWLYVAYLQHYSLCINTPYREAVVTLYGRIFPVESQKDYTIFLSCSLSSSLYIFENVTIHKSLITWIALCVTFLYFFPFLCKKSGILIPPPLSIPEDKFGVSLIRCVS